MTVIVGLSGKAKSGKNSVVHLSRIALDDYHDPPILVRSVSFADPLKEMAKEAIAEIYDRLRLLPPAEYAILISDASRLTERDIDDKTTLGRKFLQDLGMAFRIHVDQLYWVKLAAKRVYELERDVHVKIIYIPDVRFKNEADFVKMSGWKLWRVRRPVIEATQTDQHPSEIALDGYRDWDAMVIANHMSELFQAVRRELNRLGLM